MNKRTTIFVLLALSLCNAANAAIVQGTFTGTVRTSNDLTNYFGLGTGNVLRNMTITGSFSYAVNQSGPDVYPNFDTFGTSGDYHGTVFDWIQASITVAGFTESTHDAGSGDANWDSIILGPDFDRSDLLQVRDATQNPASSVFDSFFIRSWDSNDQYVGPNGLRIIWSDHFNLDISEFIDDSMIQGDGPMQSFSWTDDPASGDSASGIFNVNHQIRGFNDDGIFSLLVNQQYGMTFDVHSVDVTVSAVPVPAAVWFFVSGIAVLLGMTRTRS